MPEDSFRRCIYSVEKQNVSIYFSHFLVLTKRKSQGAGLEARGQLVGVGSFSCVGSGDVRLGGKCLYPGSLQGTRLTEDRITQASYLYVCLYVCLFYETGSHYVVQASVSAS